MKTRGMLKVESCRWAADGADSTLNRRALTLLEMMVAVSLLALIMLGLLGMFQHTQRALHIANTQADVFENVRGAIQLVSRDLSEMSAYNDTNVLNTYAISVPSPVQGGGQTGVLPLPNGTNLPVFFDETFWLTRANDEWQGVGYFVDGTNYGVGTLYRFAETSGRGSAPLLINRFNDPAYTDPANAPAELHVHRVSDGVVHFQMNAVYPKVTLPNGPTNFVSAASFEFSSNALPAFIDLEIGVLEPATLKQFNSLTGNVAVAQNFLREHVGRVHFFRERVAIRNFVNPYREHEVP